MRLSLTLQHLPLLVALAGLAGAVLPGCADPQTAPPETTTAALRRQFPGQAAAVLGAKEGFVKSGEGFTRLAPRGEERSLELAVELPADGAEPIRLRLPGERGINGESTEDFEVKVRELGARGEGRPVEHAVAYPRHQGTSFWSPMTGGVEEWLLLDAGATRTDEAAVAWEIEGATPQQRGEAVVLTDGAGSPRIHVTAPHAYAAGGRAVAARLTVRGPTIELRVDASDEVVLVDPVWVGTSSMMATRFRYTATLLANGQLLVAGGSGGTAALSGAERYDPPSATWPATGSMSGARYRHAAVRLLDDKVLVAGGTNAAGTVLATVEIYDPGANSWSGTTQMGTPRTNFIASLLPDGKVLVVGGSTAPGVYTNTTEIYDPVGKTWSLGAMMASARGAHTVTTLEDGDVLVAGGYTGTAYSAEAERYDVMTGQWSPAGTMANPRGYATATLLSDGHVVAAGGYTGSVYSNTVDNYDPMTNIWTPIAPMNMGGRGYHAAVLLPGDHVLVVGGSDGNILSSVEELDPVANVWTSMTPLIGARSQHSATVVGGTKVLAAGGTNAGPVATAELYDFAGAGKSDGSSCLQGSECLSGNCIDGVCCDTACAGLCQACSSFKKGSGTNGACGDIANGSDPDSECAGAQVCNGAGACVGGGGLGTSCAVAGECLSGFCTDGVCCNTGCGATCNACNVAGSVGTCTAIPSGQDPANECLNGACNGSGQCKLDNGQLCVLAGDCLSASCADGVCCNTACGALCQACAAAKTGGVNGTCNNVTAATDPDNECTGVTTCNGAGVCTKLANGAVCTLGGECTSGNCIDGVCCNTGCGGTCNACNLAGNVGTCTPIPSGQDPGNECTAQGASTCGTTGACDGASACQVYTAGTVCAATSCADGLTRNNADTCNGSGTCIDGGTTSCGNFACSGTGCLSSCTLDAQCAPTAYCNATVCVAKKANGLACGGANQCQSGNCVDGVCCNGACNGACQACDVAGSIGACTAIPAGQDPGNDCVAQPVGTCGTSGACDGAGACQKFAAGTVCAQPSCMGSTLNKADVCNGDGLCVDQGTQDCSPFQCASNVCPSSCMADVDCGAGNYCDPGTMMCASKKLNGDACAGANQCGSGFCADGVCCDSACGAGPCDACSVGAGAATNGVCALLTGPVCDDGNACTQTSSCQAGLCTGANPKTCPAMNACQDPGTCNPATGTCSIPNKPDGTPCTDGDACTQGDLCQSGGCVPGPAATCAPSDLCHLAGACNPVSGCSNPVKPLDCSASNPCQLAGACDLGTGLCNNPAKPDGTLCPGGFCSAGGCLADSDGDKIADMLDTCPGTFNPDQVDQDGDGLGDVCDNDLDGDGTTNNDDNCPTIANPDQNDGNNDQVGDACECAPPKTAGSPCDDLDLCTLNDTCNNAGECVPGAALICPLPDQVIDVCELAVCVPSIGACSVFNKPDGAPCPDGVCIAGGCYVESPAGVGGAGGTTAQGGSTGPGGSGGVTTVSSTGSGTGGAGAGPQAGGGGQGGDDELRLHGGCNLGPAPDSPAPWWLLGSLLAAWRRRRAARQSGRGLGR